MTHDFSLIDPQDNTAEKQEDNQSESFLSDSSALISSSSILATPSPSPSSSSSLPLITPGPVAEQELPKQYKEKEEEKEEEAEQNTSVSLLSASSERESSTSLLPNFHSTIISYLYWPSFDNGPKFDPPTDIQKIMDEYGKEFKKHKPSRHLEWLKHVGTVDLELQMESGESKQFSVTPLQATVISFFSEQDRLVGMEELASKMNTTADVVRKGISFWIGNGVLFECEKDHFKVIENSQDASGIGGSYDEEEEEGEGEGEEELENIEEFVIGMLKTHQSRPIDKIHGMLGMLIDDYSLSLSALSSFLLKLVSEEKLESPDGIIFSIHK